MSSIARRAAINGLLSKNLRPQRKGNFPVLQGGRTHKHQAYFNDDNAAKLNNSLLGGTLYSDCIIWTKAQKRRSCGSSLEALNSFQK